MTASKALPIDLNDNVRAKVKHPFHVIKQISGFVKTRHSGLENSMHGLLHISWV